MFCNTDSNCAYIRVCVRSSLLDTRYACMCQFERPGWFHELKELHLLGISVGFTNSKDLHLSARSVSRTPKGSTCWDLIQSVPGRTPFTCRISRSSWFHGMQSNHRMKAYNPPVRTSHPGFYTMKQGAYKKVQTPTDSPYSVVGPEVPQRVLGCKRAKRAQTSTKDPPKVHP